MAAITTDTQLEQEVGLLASGDTTNVPQSNPVLQNVDPVTGATVTPTGELETTAGKMLGTTTTTPTTG